VIFHSFRLRLALLLALLAGVALTGFAAAAWWLTREAKIQQVDATLRSEAEREISRARPVDGWQRYENALARIFATRDPAQVLLLVTESGDGIRFRSEHWPADLDSRSLPWPPAHLGSEIQGNDADPASFRPPPEWRSEPPKDFAPPPPAWDRDAKGPFRPPPGPPDRPGDGKGEFRPPPRGPPPAFAVTTVKIKGQRWQLGLASVPHARIAIGASLAAIDADMIAVRNAFVVAIPLALALIALGGWFLSTRALRPIQRLTATIRNVTARGLDQRIESAHEDREFAELITVFNDMLNRLERSFLQASRFSADAAHELKTPLAILQGQVERAIGQVDTGSSAQASLTSILDEIRRLSSISRKLLLLSQADAGHMRLYLTRVDLSETLGELVEDTRMLAPTLRVAGDIAPGLVIKADADLLRQLLHNLISNAIKYNTDAGWIRIAAARAGDDLEITVANSSPGIPAAERDRIFERFYRADPAHGRNIDGVGLGLSVSREIARAHGGDLVLKRGADDEALFALRIPVETRSAI
jgi:two-component system heavy metal sensor histidine kinase CusS